MSPVMHECTDANLRYGKEYVNIDNWFNLKPEQLCYVNHKPWVYPLVLIPPNMLQKCKIFSSWFQSRDGRDSIYSKVLIEFKDFVWKACMWQTAITMSKQILHSNLMPLQRFISRISDLKKTKSQLKVELMEYQLVEQLVWWNPLCANPP